MSLKPCPICHLHVNPNLTVCSQCGTLPPAQTDSRWLIAVSLLSIFAFSGVFTSLVFICYVGASLAQGKIVDALLIGTIGAVILMFGLLCGFATRWIRKTKLRENSGSLFAQIQAGTRELLLTNPRVHGLFLLFVGFQTVASLLNPSAQSTPFGRNFQYFSVPVCLIYGLAFLIYPRLLTPKTTRGADWKRVQFLSGALLAVSFGVGLYLKFVVFNR